MNGPPGSGSSVAPRIRVVADPEELARAAAGEFTRRATEAARARGRFTVALSGGSTPLSVYRLLAGQGSDVYVGRVPWEKVHLFWGDERHVPPDHPESNYGAARQAMLSRVPIPEGNVHRIPAENPDAARAADDYDRALRSFFALQEGEAPRFDLVLLGMGADGHTASLFPGSEALHETRRLVAAPWVGHLSAHRITLTPPALNAAACDLCLAHGEDKTETLRAVLAGEQRPDRYPAQAIRPERGELIWLVDRAAARLLPSNRSA